MSGQIEARFRLDRGDFRLDVDLALPGHGVSALFGHSGSGKTTCLRALAGLLRTPGGYVALNGEIWQDEGCGLFLPTHRRALGMVFQDAGLFPHLSVRGNMEFGQRRAATGSVALGDIAELLGIAHLLDRRPAQLSGGERQRVAIARALLTAPRVLLMDEPLAALDLKRKLEILPYLENLHRELDIPVIYVSHAPDEVARLADHLVLLDAGRVVASGPLNSVLSRTDLSAVFADDAGVVLETHVAEHEADAARISWRDDLCVAAPGGGRYPPALPHPRPGRQPGIGSGQSVEHPELRGGHGGRSCSNRDARPHARPPRRRQRPDARPHHPALSRKTRHPPWPCAACPDQVGRPARLSKQPPRASRHGRGVRTSSRIFQ